MSISPVVPGAGPRFTWHCLPTRPGGSDWLGEAQRMGWMHEHTQRVAGLTPLLLQLQTCPWLSCQTPAAGSLFSCGPPSGRRGQEAPRTNVHTHRWSDHMEDLPSDRCQGLPQLPEAAREWKPPVEATGPRTGLWHWTGLGLNPS